MLVVSDEGGKAILSNGVAEASNMAQVGHLGEWFLNRLKTNVRGCGNGSILLKKLQETLQAREDFQYLLVTPGGYGSDERRLIKFYEKHGCVWNAERGCWVWKPSDVV